MVLLLGFVINEIAVKRELTDKRIDLTERQRWPALQITTDKTVFINTEFECGSASILNGSHAELLGQGKHAEDAANARFSSVAVDGFAEEADLRSSPCRTRQQMSCR
jgi:hypothetical protein